MDTYVRIDYDKCQKCGLCVEACEYGILLGGRNQRPDCWSDNPPCNCCSAPCKEVCYYNAIDWERY